MATGISRKAELKALICKAIDEETLEEVEGLAEYWIFEGNSFSC